MSDCLKMPAASAWPGAVEAAPDARAGRDGREGPVRSGRGVGFALLSALIERCTALGYRQMLAVIGDSGNVASIRLHEKAGFRKVGLLPSVGFKLGRWVDAVLMQRPLGAGDSGLPDVE